MSSDDDLSPTPTRVRLLTAALLVGTFAAGTAFGAGLLVALGPRHPPPFGTPGGGPFEGPGGRPPPPFPPGPLPLAELDLSPSQHEAARAILERHRPALEGILRESFPKMRAENEAIEGEIRAILTPSQARRLDEIRASRPHPPLPPLPPPPPPSVEAPLPAPPVAPSPPRSAPPSRFLNERN